MISSRGLVSPPRAAPARNPATTMATKTASAAVSTAKTAGLRRNLVVAAAAAAAPAVGRPDAQVVTVLGTQWGDEGKGKLVDILARDFDVVARAQGGANAGHTIYDDAGKKYKLHLVPSGILHQKAACIVGNGVVVNLPGLFDELDNLEKEGVPTKGRISLSDRAHLLFGLHKAVDGAREAELRGAAIGTTGRGIGPAYASKATRNGARAGDLRDFKSFEVRLRALAADAKARFPSLDYDVEADLAAHEALRERALSLLTDSVAAINDAHDAGKRILVEGANATMLDLDFGTYPFVTSSNPSIGGVISGLGLSPAKICGCVIGVAKAYTTRVGAGPYPTEIHGDLAEEIRAIGAEYGTTTGRPRRVGWLDVPALRYAARINGLTHINLTKLDVLSDLETIKVGVGYELDGKKLVSVPASIAELERVKVIYEDFPGWKCDISGARSWDELPAQAKAYIKRVEELVGCGARCAWIGVGPGRDAIVTQPGTV